jgi:hypothetical protein
LGNRTTGEDAPRYTARLLITKKIIPALGHEETVHWEEFAGEVQGETLKGKS